MIKRILAVSACVLVLVSVLVVPSFADQPVDPLLPIVNWNIVQNPVQPDSIDSKMLILWNGLSLFGQGTSSFSMTVEGVTMNVVSSIGNYYLYEPSYVTIDYSYSEGIRTATFTTSTTVPFTFLTVTSVGSATSVEINSSFADVNELIPSNATLQLYITPSTFNGRLGNLYNLFGSAQVTDYNSFNQGYSVGEDVGYAAGEEYGYSQGLMNSDYGDAYNKGYADAEADIDSGEWGANLLGDTLSAPIEALNSFVLVSTPSGYDITLGLVVGCVIALTLFIAFLKLFAGG